MYCINLIKNTKFYTFSWSDREQGHTQVLDLTGGTDTCTLNIAYAFRCYNILIWLGTIIFNLLNWNSIVQKTSHIFAGSIIGA